MATVKMGLVQAPSTADREENLRLLLQYARQARKEGCHCICFPEAFLTGYAPEQAAERSISCEDDLLKAVAGEAVDLGLDIIVGFMEANEGHCYLTHSVFLSDGRRCDYRKTHLGEKERRFFTPGNTLPVFSLSCGIKVGFQLCVESHFPEITQTLSLKGAQVIFAPHAVPRTAGSRKDIWEKYIPCRGYDNRVIMACCNLWDAERFGGGCLVAGCRGEILASCFEEGTALVTFEADSDVLSQYREDRSSAHYRYYPGLRRPELYQL